MSPAFCRFGQYPLAQLPDRMLCCGPPAQNAIANCAKIRTRLQRCLAVRSRWTAIARAAGRLAATARSRSKRPESTDSNGSRSMVMPPRSLGGGRIFWRDYAGRYQHSSARSSINGLGQHIHSAFACSQLSYSHASRSAGAMVIGIRS